MYARQPSHPLQIPKNYSGNAFSSPKEGYEEPSPPREEPKEERMIDATEEAPKEVEALATPKRGFPLFHSSSEGRSGLGSEELLLLGLILLISQNRESDDLLLLLLLLLLIG